MTEFCSKRLVGPLLAGLLAFTFANQTVAEEDVETADPPSRVARLSYLQGDVQHRSADENTWTDAELNRPLTTHDALWTEESARAELQLGFATVHLDAATNIAVSELSDRVSRFDLERGIVAINIRRLADGEIFEIQTPKAVVSLTRPGVYRLEVSEPDDTTIVQVRNGQANVVGDRQSFTMDANERAELRGDEEQARLAAQFTTIGALDDFDEWAAARNARAERAATSRYVAADIIGYEDLDDEGEWYLDSEFGYAWYPTRVAVDWAPYRFGRWVWVSPWGWTWLDNARWGFAPFHYGRWVHRRSRWCWVPGPLGVRPVYAPALVAWMGHPGHRLGASFNVGWVPLGPREVYVPWHRTSRRYLHNINVANTIVHNTYIDEVYNRRGRHIDYMNRHAPHGLSAVQNSTFTRGRHVNDHLVRMNERSLGDFRTSREVRALRPSRESWSQRQVRQGPPGEARLGGVQRRNNHAFRQSSEPRNSWQTRRNERPATHRSERPVGVEPLREPAARADRSWRNHDWNSRREMDSPEARQRPGTDRPRWSTSRPNEQTSPRNVDPLRRREGWSQPEQRPSMRREERGQWERRDATPSTPSSAPRSLPPSFDRGNPGMRERPQRQPESQSSGNRSWEPRSRSGDRHGRER